MGFGGVVTDGVRTMVFTCQGKNPGKKPVQFFTGPLLADPFWLIGPILRDTARLSQRYPLLRAVGFLVSQHGKIGCDAPFPLF